MLLDRHMLKNSTLALLLYVSQFFLLGLVNKYWQWWRWWFKMVVLLKLRLSWGSGQFNLPKLASLLVTSTISKYKKLILISSWVFKTVWYFLYSQSIEDPCFPRTHIHHWSRINPRVNFSYVLTISVIAFLVSSLSGRRGPI